MKTQRVKTHREVLLEYLTHIAPRKATRQEIRQQTGLPSDQVLNGLLDLQRAGRVQSAVDPPDTPRAYWVVHSINPSPGTLPRSGWRKADGAAPDFETLALTCLCHYFGCHLARRSFPEHDHAFISSEDGLMLGEIVHVTDADSLAALEACRQQLASLNVPSPMLIVGGDFDILWAWFYDHAATAGDVLLFFITEKGEIILLDADMVG
jgi:hypothetical protein